MSISAGLKKTPTKLPNAALKIALEDARFTINEDEER